MITEYISAIDGTRFSLILDGKTAETLDKLLNLCDIRNYKLIFDIAPGSLRETKLYSIGELILQAKQEGV